MHETLGRLKCIAQIGMVHHQRLRNSISRKEPMEKLASHARSAVDRHLDRLELCAKDAIKDQYCL
jgi:hypothetical protein